MRPQWICILAVVCTVLSACKRDGANSSTPQSAEGAIIATAALPLTQPNTPETQLLTQNYWVAEFYVIPGEEGKIYPARQNKGLWWKFNIDGTYVGGQWEEQYDKGSWFWRAGSSEYEKRGVLYIDSAVDDMRDVEFQMQGVQGDGSAMSWVKTQNSKNREPGMLKIIQLMTMPTKKQFDVE